MITPIIITSSGSHESWGSQVDRAAREYSTSQDMQRAFRDGAKWEKGDISTKQAFFGIFILIFCILQFISACMGLLDGTMNYGKEKTTGKWGYVFPLYSPAKEFSKWMSE